MLNHSKTGLLIFDNVRIDFNLPKWKDKIEQAKHIKETGGIIYRRNYSENRVDPGGFLSAIAIPQSQAMGASGTVSGGEGGDKKPNILISGITSFFQRRKIKSIKAKQQEDMAQAPNFTERNMTLEEYQVLKTEKEAAEHDKNVDLTVSDFFAGIKGNVEHLELAMERYKAYEKVLEHLKLTGQTAIHETMCLDFEIHVAESKLFGMGFKKLITERNVIEFAKKAPRTVKLDWIANFTRAIPQKALEVKLKLDAAGIFDNYVIMHFDPKSTSEKTAEEKKEDEEDPILFGIIAGRQKLYYVADWIDKYCNLTFDVIVEQLGEEAVNANDLTTEIKMVTDNNS